MTRWWTGLVWVAAILASSAPAYAQFLGNQPEGPPPAVDPLPFGPSTADVPTPPFPPAGMTGNGSNTLPDNLPNASSPPPMHEDPNHFYVSIEYLHWWSKADNYSNLIVTSSAQPNINTDFGALFQPNTTTIGPGLSGSNGLDGVRSTLGLAPDWFVPIEITGFYVAGSQGFAKVSDGSATSKMLALAIFSLDPAINTEGVNLIAFPNLVRGQIGVNQSTAVFGGEVNLLVLNLIRWPDFQALGLEGTIGARYVSLNDDLQVTTTTTNLVAAPILAFNGGAFGQNFTVATADLFKTRNQFYGPQFGLRASYPIGPLNLQIKNNFAAGVNNEIVSVMGATALYGPNPPPSLPPSPPVGVTGAGIYALPSNSGRFTRQKFCTVDELTIALGLPITEKWQLSIGYNLFYMTNVVRPGDQLNRFIDTRQTPSSANFAAGAVTQPPFLFNGTSYYANGLTFSMEFTW